MSSAKHKYLDKEKLAYYDQKIRKRTDMNLASYGLNNIYNESWVQGRIKYTDGTLEPDIPNTVSSADYITVEPGSLLSVVCEKT